MAKVPYNPNIGTPPASREYTSEVHRSIGLVLRTHADGINSLHDGVTGAGTLAADLNASDFAIYNFRTKKYNNLSGAQTLSGANFDSGATLVHFGAAATYTLPSRVTATTASEQLVIHNRGSGAITLTASGVTIKGATSITTDASAVLEWEHDGTTEYCWVRTS
jgi:hypothetical protein